MTYGRLSQWADHLGHAYRSSKNLAEEIGTSEKSIEKYLKELRLNNLIGTYHPQAGGINHFEFYDHPWMHEPIKEQLIYKEDKFNPPSNCREPSLQSEGTPPSNCRDINNKEIKENKKTTTTSKQGGGGSLSKTKKQMLEHKCHDDPRGDEEFLENCEHHLKNHSPKDASPYKQVMMLIALLKTLYGIGEHFKSKGFVSAKEEESRLRQEAEKKRIQDEYSEKERLKMMEAAKSKPRQEKREHQPRSYAEIMKNGFRHAQS